MMTKASSALLGLFLLVMASPFLMSGCGKVCVAGVGDCSELNKKTDNPVGGDFKVRFDPAKIGANTTSNLIGSGGRTPCQAPKQWGGGTCQLVSYNGAGCSAVVRGVSEGVCKFQMMDADSIVASAVLDVSGGTPVTARF